jgi:hypothetical protein
MVCTFRGPIYKAEQCHTGGHLCRHNHRTISGAERCLPRLPRGQGTTGAFSMASVVPQNEAAERELAAWSALSGVEH